MKNRTMMMMVLKRKNRMMILKKKNRMTILKKEKEKKNIGKKMKMMKIFQVVGWSALQKMDDLSRKMFGQPLVFGHDQRSLDC